MVGGGGRRAKFRRGWRREVKGRIFKVAEEEIDWCGPSSI